MDNLHAVALAERRARPVGAADDDAVKLDGEAFGRELEMCDERVERNLVGHVARLSVEFDTQRVLPRRCRSVARINPRRVNSLRAKGIKL